MDENVWEVFFLNLRCTKFLASKLQTGFNSYIASDNTVVSNTKLVLLSIEPHWDQESSYTPPGCSRF